MVDAKAVERDADPGGSSSVADDRRSVLRVTLALLAMPAILSAHD